MPRACLVAVLATAATAWLPERSRRRSRAPFSGRRDQHSRAAGGDGSRPHSPRASWSTQYLVRIALYEDRLNAALAVNPRALEEADALDRERAQGKVRGPLHGIPVALKDNIHTTHMPTTGGALAFAGYMPPYEATLTKNLRDAGAIIIAKAGLTELANWVAGAPTPMPGNYNAVGGFALQPVRSAARSARRDVRRPAGAANRRIELRHRHRGELLGRQRRHRHRRLGDQPVERQHARRHPPDDRPHQPLRRDSDHRRSRHRRPDDAHGGRRGDPAGRARERVAGSATIAATTTCTPPPGRDYTKFLNAGGAQGRAHRHSARVLLRPHHVDRR